MKATAPTVALPPPKYLPAQFEAMCDDNLAPLLRLAEARALIVGVRFYCGELARAANAEGASWTQIGKALGVTRQAALAMFGGEAD